MARKSKKSRNSGKRRGSAEPAVATLEAVREHLERGSSKRALQAAKQAAKAHPGPAADELLLAAYRARIRDLAQAGLEEEAGALIAIVTERFGDEVAGLDADAERLAFRSDPARLLREWSRSGLSDERRRAIAERLRSDLVDPGVLAASPELAEDDPLKRAARAVVVGLEEAAAGTLSEEARRGLATVSRRSPLAPWRTFCLSLDAFHADDDERVAELLASIPEDSAPAQAARLLRVLMGEVEAPADLPPAAGSILRRVGGEIQALRALATRLRVAGEQDDWRGAERAVLRLVPGLAAHDQRLAQAFCRWVGGGGVDIDPKVLDPVVESALGAAEANRLLALECSEVAPLMALGFWCDWCEGREMQGRRLSAAELPIAAEHLGELAWRADRAMMRRGGGSPPLDDWVLDEIEAAVSDGAQRHRLQDVLDQLSPSALDRFVVKLNEARLARVFTEAAGRPVRFRHLSGDLLDLAIELDATPERFRRRVERLPKGARSEREKILGAWAAALPSDAEPWVRLADDCARRSALKKGLRHLEEAERRDPLSAEVRGLRFRLLVGNLLRHLRDRRLALVEKDIAELQDLPAAATPARRLFVLAARVAAAAETEAEAEVLVELEKQAGTASRAAALRALLDHLATPPRRRLGLRLKGSVGDRLAAAGLILRVAREAHYDPLEVLGPEDIPRRPRAKDLPTDSEELLLLCEWARDADAWDLQYVASGRGLLADGPRLISFLDYRHDMLGCAELHAAAEDCHRLLQHLATRAGDAEILAGLRFCICDVPQLDEPLGEGEARAILERERKQQGTLEERVRKGDGASPSSPAPARTRRQRRHRELDWDQLALPFGDDIEEAGP